LAVTVWRLRRWRLWFLALMTATHRINLTIFTKLVSIWVYTPFRYGKTEIKILMRSPFFAERFRGRSSHVFRGLPTIGLCAIAIAESGETPASERVGRCISPLVSPSDLEDGIVDSLAHRLAREDSFLLTLTEYFLANADEGGGVSRPVIFLEKR